MQGRGPWLGGTSCPSVRCTTPRSAVGGGPSTMGWAGGSWTGSAMPDGANLLPSADGITRGTKESSPPSEGDDRSGRGQGRGLLARGHVLPFGLTDHPEVGGGWGHPRRVRPVVLGQVQRCQTGPVSPHRRTGLPRGPRGQVRRPGGDRSRLRQGPRPLPRGHALPFGLTHHPRFGVAGAIHARVRPVVLGQGRDAGRGQSPPIGGRDYPVNQGASSAVRGGDGGGLGQGPGPWLGGTSRWTCPRLRVAGAIHTRGQAGGSWPGSATPDGANLPPSADRDYPVDQGAELRRPRGRQERTWARSRPLARSTSLSLGPMDLPKVGGGWGHPCQGQAGGSWTGSATPDGANLPPSADGTSPGTRGQVRRLWGARGTNSCRVEAPGSGAHPALRSDARPQGQRWLGGHPRWVGPVVLGQVQRCQTGPISSHRRTGLPGGPRKSESPPSEGGRQERTRAGSRPSGSGALLPLGLTDHPKLSGGLGAIHARVRPVVLGQVQRHQRGPISLHRRAGLPRGPGARTSAKSTSPERTL